ncbi:MAG: hypothetical protein K9N11_04780, partial [Lentisphaeria bacterium]|nr:hypothetical protein [Lentisphaeria bacterium]
SIIGYISNAGQSYMALTGLYLKRDKEEPQLLVPGAEGFDWAPDGECVVVSRKNFWDGGLVVPPALRNATAPGMAAHHHPTSLKQQQNCDRCNFALTGSRFNDLFSRSIHPDSSERQLTFGERAKNPAWSPGGGKIVYVSLHDGTNNLKMAFPDYPDSTVSLTQMLPGTQVFTPRWLDSTHIIFDYVNGYNRDIGLLNLETNSWTPLLDNDWDERDPYPVDENTLIYAHDRSGVFNIYQRDLVTGSEAALTHVVGGAFQPELHNDRLIYSLYDSLGYNIAELRQQDFYYTKNPESGTGDTSTPVFFQRDLPAKDWSRHESTLQHVPYELRYGPMFILPRLQVDIDKSKNKTVVKPGLYFFSNEILDNYLLMGGGDFGLNGDSDLFLLAEYHGFLPTLSLEVYHMTRNTREDLIYYDGVYTAESEIKFRLTEATLKAAVRLPDIHYLDADLRAGTYNTYIDDHLITTGDGGNLAVGGLSYDYFKGIDWGVHYRYAGLAVRQESGINPSGFQFDISLRDNYHNFMDQFGYNEDTGSWGEIYNLYHYQRLDMKTFYGKRLGVNSKTVLSLNTDIAVLPHNQLDDFFYDFGGGLPGLRGYPFYGISGTRKAVVTGALRFPVMRNLYQPIAQFGLQDIYLGIVGQIGSAWTGEPDANLNSEQDISSLIRNDLANSRWRKDVGVELRLKGFSFYGYPTAIEFSGYYGLDPLTVETLSTTYQYGREMRYYWRILFGFE